MKIAHIPHRWTLAALLGGLAMLTLTSGAQAGMQWKWRDATGAVQYSDRAPPPGTPEKDILNRPAAARSLPAARPLADAASAPQATASAAAKPEAKASDPELEAKRKKAEEEKKAQEKATEEKNAKARAENCQRARNYLRTLAEGIRLSRTNANGEREILDDTARAAEQRQAEEIARANCR